MTATPTQVGRFRFGTATDRWWWSDHMFLIHGMQPGDVVPTRELLLTHAQRGDRAVVAETLDRCADEPDPRSCAYALADLSGTAHRVVLAVAGDGGGDVAGYLVDVTAAHDSFLAEHVNAELTLALESHAAIDQAKGILMVTYGVGADEAFAILKQSSQRHNIRLRALAAEVVQTAMGGLEATTRELLDETLCSPAGQDPPADATRRRARLDVRVDHHGDGPVLRVTGTVDLSNRDELADAITLAMLGAADAGRVTVDLRELSRIGPAVVDVITAALRRSAAHGITLTVVGGGRGPAGASARARRSSVATRS